MRGDWLQFSYEIQLLHLWFETCIQFAATGQTTGNGIGSSFDQGYNGIEDVATLASSRVQAMTRSLVEVLWPCIESALNYGWHQLVLIPLIVVAVVELRETLRRAFSLSPCGFLDDTCNALLAW